MRPRAGAKASNSLAVADPPGAATRAVVVSHASGSTAKQHTAIIACLAHGPRALSWHGLGPLRTPARLAGRAAPAGIRFRGAALRRVGDRYTRRRTEGKSATSVSDRHDGSDNIARPHPTGVHVRSRNITYGPRQ